jgi:HlyD family secretion protein
MNASPTFLIVAALSVSSVRAAESTELALQARPFVIRHAITANALPEAFKLIQLKAEAWSEFPITRIAAHGSRVAKGEVLVEFDPQGIDRKIEDTARAIDTKTLEIAQAEPDLKNLEETTPHRLLALQRAADEAKEENDYFTKVRRKAEEENADQKLKRAEMLLENQSEELRQLKKMYEADDLTEDTEEIILKRQQDRVEAAEFELRMQRLAHARSHAVLLPRETVKLAEAQRDTAIALAKFQHDAPRAIAVKKIELQNLKTALEREKQTLEDLKADRQQFEITAPADGWFYHGAIENERWTPGEAAKSLFVHGRPAVRKAFATFIPADAKLKLVAFLDGSIASQLAPEAGGVAWVSGREDAEFPVKLTALNAAPDADGRFKAEFSAEWPDQPAVAPAAGLNIHVITHQSQEAIVLPAKALELGAAGWTVEVKLADGKTERRPVKRGRLHDGQCEILSGLEPGQVVIIP